MMGEAGLGLARQRDGAVVQRPRQGNEGGPLKGQGEGPCRVWRWE